MAENPTKLQASRSGYRAHLTQTRKKALTIMAKETPSELDFVSLNNILEQLARKKSILKELDQKIVAILEDSAELEKEIFDTEVIQEEIDETSSQVSNFIHQSLSVKKSPPSTSQSNTSNQGTPPVVVLLSENAQPPSGPCQTLVLQGPQRLKEFLVKQPLVEPLKSLKFKFKFKFIFIHTIQLQYNNNKG